MKLKEINTILTFLILLSISSFISIAAGNILLGILTLCFSLKHIKKRQTLIWIVRDIL